MANVNCQQCGSAWQGDAANCPRCGEAVISSAIWAKVGGRILEHYQVTGILGLGGMSVVYRGFHVLSGQNVAIKVLLPEHSHFQPLKARMQEEARALATLDHSNIVHLYNFGVDGDCFAMAMQLVEGTSWETRIADAPPWQESVFIARQVASALHCAHSHRIIHRDLKPSNVLISRDGVAKLSDFGIAKLPSSSKLTETGQTMGTVRYMSPEQVRGESVGPASDVYSLGASLYQSLTGRTPFDADNHFTIMSAHLNEPVVPPRNLVPSIPVHVEKWVMRALEKQAERRPMVQDMAIGLAEGSQPDTLQLQTITEPTSRPGWLARRSLWLFAAGLGAVVGGVIFFWAVSKRQAAPVVRPANSARSMQFFGARQPVWQAQAKNPGAMISVYSEVSVSAENVVERVMAFQRRFADKAVANQMMVAAMPISVYLVSAATLCSPAIYENGVVPDDCPQQGYFYRPIETALFVLASEGWKARLDAGLGIAVCTHVRDSRCQAVLDAAVEVLENRGGPRK